MKKVFITLLISAFALQIGAQEITTTAKAGTISIIPKVGYNMSNISKLKGDPRHGVNVGASVEYMFTDMLGVEGGLYYSMQGKSWKASYNNTASGKITLKDDYINVPILFKAYVYDGFNIFAGPQIGFLVSGKAEAKASVLNFLNVSSGDIDIKDYLKSTDFSGIIGIGYQSSMGLMISASYNIGFTKLFDVDVLKWGDGANEKINVDLDARNNVFQVNLGYKF